MTDKKSLLECEKSEFLAFFLDEKRGFRHTNFYHYTSFEKLKEILDSSSIWLTQLKESSNDKIEKDFYKNSGKYLFSLCFSTGTSESFPLWFLYAGADGLGARIKIRQKIMKEWLDPTIERTSRLVPKNSAKFYLLIKSNSDKIPLQKEDFEYSLHDILYCGPDSEHIGKYRLKHNGNTRNSLCKEDYEKIRASYQTFQKGLIWFYEKETRLQVEIKNKALQRMIDENEECVVVLDLGPIRNYLEVTFGPNFKKKAKDLAKNFSQYESSLFFDSEYQGKFDFNIKTRICKECKNNKK